VTAVTDWFAGSMASDQVRRRSARGVAASMLRRVAVHGIRLLSVMVLARLLTPDDMGLMAMVVAFTGLASLLVDLQLTAVTIRYQALTHAQASALFWLRLGMALVFAALVALVAPGVERLYGDPRVLPMTQLLALGIVLGALGMQHSALLTRTLHIVELARIEVLAAMITAVVSVLAAMRGWGYWSLVAGSLAGSAVGSLLAWSLCDWRPRWQLRCEQQWLLLRDGLRYLAYSVLAFVSGNLANLLAGRGWGAEAAGQYSRAVSLQALMLSCLWDPLGSVAAPAMARLQAETQALSNYYYKVTALTVIAAMPIAFVGLVLPQELVRVLLGEQWQWCAEILRLLSLGVLPAVLCNSAGWVFFSVGQTKAVMQWGIIGWGGMIVATALGALWSVEGIALATTLAAWLLTWPCLRMAYRGTALSIPLLMRWIARPVAAALLAGLASWAVLSALSAQVALVRLLFGLGFFVTLDLLLLLTVFGQRPLFVQLLSLLRDVPTAASESGPAQR
jgi:O-antigen/teichoic acid export membrane protein